MKSNDPLYGLWLEVTSAPYRGIPWVVFFYVIISCLLYTDNGPFTGHIVGFDDQVRMTQVLQWVNGAGWYDRMITRVNAPEGFHTIWARIVDIPFAAVIVLAQLFVDQKTAALVSSVLIPMGALGLMFFAARYYARPIAGKNEARLVILFLMFTTVLNHKIYTLAGFHIGEASHHAWYGILNVVVYGAAIRIVLGVAGIIPQVTLALAIALLLAVGVEGIPMIAGCAAILSILSWAFQNHYLAQRSAAAFGLGTFLSLLLLPMHVQPSQWLTISFIEPSLLGPALIFAATAYLGLQILIIKNFKDRVLSAVMLAATAGMLAVILLWIFPDILNGVTSGLSPNERKLAASEHPEIWTMWQVASDGIDYACLVVPSLIALGTGIAAAFASGNKRQRMMYLAYSGFVALPSGLAQIYWRYIHHAQTAVCPLLLYAWQWIRKRSAGVRFSKAVSVLVFFLLGPCWMVIFPAINTGGSVLATLFFFPAKIYTEPYSCDPLSIADYLNRHYSSDVRINVPDWDTSAFLYETKLKVDFLSNYPSHDHFIDNKAFFDTTNMDQARQIAARHQFNLVSICSHIPMSTDFAASRLMRQPTMIERIKEGIQPAWLKPVILDIPTPYLLFEVDQAAIQGS